jgi:hypothetical protein
VVLPEVFLKAVALARNRGIALAGLTTVNLDFMRLYRPQTNVVIRPPASTGGKGYSLVGHHEILIPLLAAALVEQGSGSREGERYRREARDAVTRPGHRRFCSASCLAVADPAYPDQGADMARDLYFIVETLLPSSRSFMRQD